MATNPDTRSLPPGWTQQFNEEHKTWFYVNKGAPGGPKSQWTHPADDQEAYAPPPGPPPPGRSPAPVQSNNDPSRAGQSPSYYSSNSQQPAYNGQNSPSYSGQPSYNAPSPVPGQKGLGGLLSKLTGHNQQQGYPQQYGGGGGYPQQQAYGGYPQQQYGGYPQQAGYGGQPMYAQQPQRHSGLGAGGGAALGLGGGLLGGMLIGDMVSNDENQSYDQGYDQGQMNDNNDYGGGDDGGGGGDMGGGF